MAQAIAIPAGATEKVVTGVSAFGTGLGMSFVVKTWPAVGIMGNILAMGIGLGGALLTRGLLSDALLGVGAGSAAILGSSIAWLPEGGGGRPITRQIQKGGQPMTLQLRGGPATATGEMAARMVGASVLEF